MVSAIRAAISITSYNNHTYNQSRVGFASLPHVVGKSTNGASGEGDSTPLELHLDNPGDVNLPLAIQLYPQSHSMVDRITGLSSMIKGISSIDY